MGEDDDRYASPETVELHAEVPIEGASEEQIAMYQEMATVFEDRFRTFVEKNLDYNSSFLTAGEIEQILASGDGLFENAKHANLYKLFTRIQDKDQRFYSLVFGGGENLVDEKPAETAGDAGVYWFMVEWLLRYGDED